MCAEFPFTEQASFVSLFRGESDSPRRTLAHFVDQLRLQYFPWSDCYVSVKELFECRPAIGETEKTVG